MPKILAEWINEHEFPKIYFRFPGLLSLQWLANRLIYHRSWAIRKAVGKHLKQHPNELSFLDAGCGAGDFLVPFARKFRSGCFTGVDKSAANIKMVRHFCDRKGISNVTLIESDLEKLGYVGNYSVILCASVLHYVTNRQNVLHSFYKILKPGGSLIIYVPINYNRRIPGYDWIRKQFFHHVDYECGKSVNMNLNQEVLISELENAGFLISDVRYLYGSTGQVAYEISSLALLSIQKAPWLLSALITIIYFPVVHPFVLGLLLFDYKRKCKSGNGLLLISDRN